MGVCVWVCVQDTHTRGFFYRGWGPTTQTHKSHKPSSSLTDGLDQLTSKGPSQAEAPRLSLKFLGSTEEADGRTWGIGAQIRPPTPTPQRTHTLPGFGLESP